MGQRLSLTARLTSMQDRPDAIEGQATRGPRTRPAVSDQEYMPLAPWQAPARTASGESAFPTASTHQVIRDNGSPVECFRETPSIVKCRTHREPSFPRAAVSRQHGGNQRSGRKSSSSWSPPVGRHGSTLVKIGDPSPRPVQLAHEPDRTVRSRDTECVQRGRETRCFTDAGLPRCRQ